MGEIINKVSESSLETFDLEDFFPVEKFIALDISKWLYEGKILKEKEYRLALNNFDFTIYNGKNIGLFCSTDAISFVECFYLRKYPFEICIYQRPYLLLWNILCVASK